eukprot:766476-Hanusia_phi.AAC.4
MTPQSMIYQRKTANIRMRTLLDVPGSAECEETVKERKLKSKEGAAGRVDAEHDSRTKEYNICNGMERGPGERASRLRTMAAAGQKGRRETRERE